MAGIRETKEELMHRYRGRTMREMYPDLVAACFINPKPQPAAVLRGCFNGSPPKNALKEELENADRVRSRRRP